MIVLGVMWKTEGGKRREKLLENLNLFLLIGVK